MSYLATTRGALLRGTDTTDALGDDADDNSEAAIVEGWEDWPLGLIEKKGSEFSEATNTWRTIYYFAGRAPGNLPVEYGDRIRDNRDGRVYSIEEIHRTPRSLAGTASVTLRLRRTATP